MKTVCVVLVIIGVATSQLIAQGGDRNAYDVRTVIARPILSRPNPGVWQTLDGGVCFPAPFYQNCVYSYNYSYFPFDYYGLWIVYAPWNGAEGSVRPQPSSTKPEPAPSRPAPPPPPVTPVIHEYTWPKEENPSATFSIVTTSGTAYLATLVWVQDGSVHFSSPEGDVRQLPLSSVSNLQ